MIDSLSIGGAEKVVLDTALSLDNEKYDVTVCETRSAGILADNLASAGVSLMTLGRRRAWELHKFLPLLRHLTSHKVDIIHSHKWGSNQWGRLVGVLAGVPYIISHEHTSTFARGLLIALDRITSHLSDSVVVVSLQGAQALSRREGVNPKKIVYIPNGVDLTKFTRAVDVAAVKTDLGISASDRCIGIVATLGKVKRHEDFLSAAAIVAKEESGVRFVVVGDGARRQELEAMARSLGIFSRTVFTGARRDIPGLVQAFEIGVLCSEAEAMPLAVLEYMAAAKPVIATRVDDIERIVEDGISGILVPPRTPLLLAEAMLELLQDADKARSFGRAGRNRVEERFSLRASVAQVEALYDLLANKAVSISTSESHGEK